MDELVKIQLELPKELWERYLKACKARAVLRSAHVEIILAQAIKNFIEEHDDERTN